MTKQCLPLSEIRRQASQGWGIDLENQLLIEAAIPVWALVKVKQLMKEQGRRKVTFRYLQTCALRDGQVERPSCGELWVILPDGSSGKRSLCPMHTERVIVAINRGGHIIVRHIYEPKPTEPRPTLPHINMSKV